MSHAQREADGIRDACIPEAICFSRYRAKAGSEVKRSGIELCMAKLYYAQREADGFWDVSIPKVVCFLSGELAARTGPQFGKLEFDSSFIFRIFNSAYGEQCISHH